MTPPAPCGPALAGPPRALGPGAALRGIGRAPRGDPPPSGRARGSAGRPDPPRGPAPGPPARDRDRRPRRLVRPRGGGGRPDPPGPRHRGGPHPRPRPPGRAGAAADGLRAGPHGGAAGRAEPSDVETLQARRQALDDLADLALRHADAAGVEPHGTLGGARLVTGPVEGRLRRRGAVDHQPRRRSARRLEGERPVAARVGHPSQLGAGHSAAWGSGRPPDRRGG